MDRDEEHTFGDSPPRGDPRTPSEEERARLIYSLLLPAVRTARQFKVPLGELIRWLKLAYFHELRASGLTLREASDVMEVSMPTTARLSRALKGSFYAPEREHQLPQRIEFLLWADGQSRARIHQCLPDYDNEDIDAALQQMQGEGRLRVSGDREVFEVVKSEARLVRGDWVARIGSLNSLLDNLSDAVWQRLILERPEAFARTLNFRIRDVDIAELRTFYEEELWPRMSRFDEAARSWAARRSVKLSIFWAPSDHPSE
ncbi:MAG: hypothetical protein CMH57_06665 [Myxococcales bacterium]|nr:hypothetical protein [Myxococcales bacterium]